MEGREQTPEEIASLVKREVNTTMNESVKAGLFDILVSPRLQMRKWDYSLPRELLPCWIVAELPGTHLGLAYSPLGHGRRGDRWGVVELKGEGFGRDDSWFLTLEDALINSGQFQELQDHPRDRPGIGRREAEEHDTGRRLRRILNREPAEVAIEREHDPEFGAGPREQLPIGRARRGLSHWKHVVPRGTQGRIVSPAMFSSTSSRIRRRQDARDAGSGLGGRRRRRRRRRAARHR